jgi:ABC-type antimicrobial peptide transport system permease subunit
MDKEHAPLANAIEQSPGYMAAIHLPLLRGRGFDILDGSAGHLSAIVTRDFAARFWPDRDAIGRRFRFLDKDTPGDWITVVGVSGNLAQGFDTAPLPLLFLPYRRDAWDSMALAIPAAKPKAMIPAVRAALASLDPDLPIYGVSTMAEFESHQIWFLRVFGTVFGVFSCIALLMASVGIYAVMAQATGSRTREIGVRMALGATPRRILMLMLRRGAWQLAAGVSAGAAVAIPAAMALRGLPFLDSPFDPRLLAVVAMLLSGVGLFACWLPARRAATVNPVAAIRHE